jgi:hypothetical protein
MNAPKPNPNQMPKKKSTQAFPRRTPMPRRTTRRRRRLLSMQDAELQIKKIEKSRNHTDIALYAPEERRKKIKKKHNNDYSCISCEDEEDVGTRQ